MNNPFQTILNELQEVKVLLKTIKVDSNIELEQTYYTIQEVADKLKLDYQTIRNHIQKGNIKAEKIGRQYRINHVDLMKVLEETKSLKYKR